MNNREFRLAPDAASTFAHSVDGVILFLFIVSVFFTVLIAALIIFFAVKYRRRPTGQPGTGQFPAQSPGSGPGRYAPNEIRRAAPGLQGAAAPPPASGQPVPAGLDEHSRQGMALEIAWTAIPLLLTVVMFWAGARVFIRQSQPPPDAMEIDVVGKQWMWTIEHPNGSRETNELHVPVGRPVRLRMISQDVIHSFGLPDFRVKQDVIPGRYVSMWFEATKVGQYNLFCNQYCGTQHANMVGRVVVMTEKDYQNWLDGTKPNVNAAEAGRELYNQYGCASCHSAVAPSLGGVYGRKVYYRTNDEDESAPPREIIADENYLRESILNPAAKIVVGYKPLMPSFRGQLTEEQVNQLIAYMKSLGTAYEPPATSQPAAPGGAPGGPAQTLGGPQNPLLRPDLAKPGPGNFESPPTVPGTGGGNP